TQLVDLAAGVVEVILARHVLPAGLEDATEQVADERPAGIPDGQRTGRIRRYELDVHAAAGDRLDPTPSFWVGQDPVDDRLERSRLQADVEEARGRDLCRFDRRRVPGHRCVAHELRGEQRREL